MIDVNHFFLYLLYMKKILVTGAAGQIGSELTVALAKKYGAEHVLATDIKEPKNDLGTEFEILDVLDDKKIAHIAQEYNIDTIYHLVGILSAAGENNPDIAWMVNINSLKSILNLGKSDQIKQIFWPSSIAAFGPGSPKENTPQATIMDPNTIYGITKWTGELLCNYYYNKYRVDVRSLRYPGLISYVTPPGGGTTDYAIDIFYHAVQGKTYNCFLREDTMMPMMYMPDALAGTLQLMKTPAHNIKTHFSYNFTAMSFTPKEIAEEIQKHIPDFKILYTPDKRQNIADTWPRSVDDSAARRDWGWKHTYNLSRMVEDMLKHVKEKLS